jgi:hypothetical protein
MVSVHCIEKGGQVGDQDVGTFLEHYITDTVQTRGLVATKFGYRSRDLIWGNGREPFYWIGIDSVWRDRINDRGRRKE